jgi:transcriptional regulator with XRE-family HTH domain
MSIASFPKAPKICVPSKAPGPSQEEGATLRGMGVRLQTIRRRGQLSLREVEQKSHCLAQQWGNLSCQISASWLARLEREGHGLSVNKLIVLARIYGIPVEELLRPIPPEDVQPMLLKEAAVPNAPMLLTGGNVEEQARRVLTDGFYSDVAPEETALLSGENAHSQAPYKRGVIGKHDLTLDPMITAGSIVQIDTRKRAIWASKEWGHEFRRPIYFLMTRDAYACGWCELDKGSEWLTLIPHPLSPALSSRWRYGKDVECVGRVVFVGMRLSQ